MERARYEILDVIGRGGFGTVYRARRLGAYGFQREVALKVLDDIDPPAEVLARFRDESRLLGRVRLQSLPGVGPPIRLDDHWAVEMDLVDGVDCHRIARKHGALPARVALEVIAEVADTLHALYHWRDEPTGKPLALVHRDIKPSNIMVSRTGHVHLLDFGIARAEFDTREALTTDHIGGTVGFIPPERLEGKDGPEGDVFSLGVVLHLLITGQKPTLLEDGEAPPVESKDARGWALELAGRMRALRPDDRPPADEVARACRELAAQAGGRDKREWCGKVLPERVLLKADDRVGTTMVERGPEKPPPSRWWALPMYTFGALGAALFLVTLGGLFAWAITPRSTVIRPPFTPDMPVAPALGGTRPDRVEEVATAAPEPVAPVVQGPPGRVVVEGVRSAWLQRSGRKYELTDVRPGRYDVWVRFATDPVHAATVEVAPGATVRLTCNDRFLKCR